MTLFNGRASCDHSLMPHRAVPTVGRLLLTLFALALAIASAQTPAAWRDPSPHQTRMVTIADSVQLEVLDWGGTARPLVLLAGYLTAHAYDEFAPRLTPTAHVYAVTRRGLGASTLTPTGYTARESAQDVVRVLEELNLTGVVLAGHSLGGQDITHIAVQFPERIAGLIYLNSAEDPTRQEPASNVKPPDRSRLPSALRQPAPADMSSPQAYRAWQRRTHGIAFTEAELRRAFAVRPDGSLGEYQVPRQVRDGFAQSFVRSEYDRIRVPVLTFAATPPELAVLAARYAPANDDERAALAEKRAHDLAFAERQLRYLQEGVPNAKIVRVPGANFYIFASHPEELAAEMRAFLATLH